MNNRRINENLIRKAPKSPEAILNLLFDGLDWPRPKNMDVEDVPLLEWTPEELHLDPASVAKLTEIRQLPALTAKQPFGVFILSFSGGQLPVGAIRRVVSRLVRKKRAGVKGAKSQWNLNDLIFFCQSSNGVSTLHVVAFRETNNVPVLRVMSWDTAATDNRIELIASENLPALTWPSGDSIDVDEWRDQWTSAFTTSYREGIKSSAALAAKMAEVAKVVRDEVLALYSVESKNGPLRQLFDEVKKNLRADLTPESFADMYAQTMVYGLLTARITHPEDFEADALNSVLKFENPFLDALYSSFRRTGDQAFDVDEFGLHDLAEVLARANMDQVLADFGAAERKDDPVVFFYEEFLDRYDPAQRKELGTYYTPIPVVRFMVRAVDEIIKTEFNLPLGVADQTTWGEYSKSHGIKIPEGLKAGDKVIRMIDPATGTGTFLLEWMRQAETNLREAGKYSQKAMKAVVEQMDAFEISLSSYAVAHLKTSLELDPELRATTHMGIRLTNTLSEPSEAGLKLFGEDPIAREGQLAEHVKYEGQHSVVIGNPPYKDKAKGFGPIIEIPQGNSPHSLLDDFTPDSSRGLGAHTKILRNLYVYFWRWSLDKAFGTPERKPGVVAFITSAAWLTGPVFETMREIIRKGHKVWIVNLNGDVKVRNEGDENVFAGIQLPTAVCIVFRGSNAESGELKFVDLFGSRAHKFDYLSTLGPYSTLWTDLSSPQRTPIGHVKSSEWEGFMPLGELMPFHANGIHQQRTWVNDPSVEVLVERWRALANARVSNRAELMKETHSKKVDSPGRDLDSGAPLGSLDHRINQEPVSIIRYSFRTLDRQWLIADSRVIDRPSPELWAVRSERQIFLNELHSHPVGCGPSVVVTGFIPNLDHFHGRGGRVIPVFRDAKVLKLNLLPGLVDYFASRVKTSINPEELIAYAVGLTAFPAFQDRFADDLRQGGVRIPLITDVQLIREFAALGEDAVELFTYCERTLQRKRARLNVRLVTGPAVRKGTRISSPPDVIVYDDSNRCLNVGSLVVENVSPDVWSYQVSGMQVVKKWLGYRKARPTTKWSSSLNEIVSESWPKAWTEELLDLLHVVTQLRSLEATHERLLGRVLESETIPYSEILGSGLMPPPKWAEKPDVTLDGLLEDDD